MNHNDIEQKIHRNASDSHVLKFMGVFGLVQGLKILASLVRNKLSSLLLSTTGFGLVAVYQSIVDFVTSTTNCGIPLSTTQRASELFEDGQHDETARFACTVRTWTVWTSLSAALMSIVFAPVLSYFFFDEAQGHWLEIAALAPMAMAMLVAGCECSLLKGLRQLRTVAVVESLVAVSTVVCTVPFFYFWHLRGIIAALVVSTLAAMVIHLCFSTRCIPYRIAPLSGKVLRQGWPFVRRGLPYVLSGITTSLATMATPLIILSSGTMEDVGLYRAAFTLMVSYAGMAFVALEADYYPRLSATHQHPERMNACVNQQMRACVLLIAPLLVLLTTALPLVVRILFTADFSAVVTMATCAAFYTFFRALMLPVGYISLAWRESHIFLLVEVCYNAAFCLFVWLGWTWGQLMGVGIAFSAITLIEMFALHAFYGYKFGFRLSAEMKRIGWIQFLLLAADVALCLVATGWTRYLLGAALFIASAAYSIAIFKTKIKTAQ